jgi:replicative DNA helicase
MELPILCLAQLNRQADQDQQTQPRLSHLRESGAIEQDADVVLMLWRPEFGGPGDNHAKLKVSKQRNGRNGQVFDLTWDPSRVRFATSAPEYRSDAEVADLPGYEPSFDDRSF